MGLLHSKNSNEIEKEILFLKEYPNYKKQLSFDIKHYEKQQKNENQETEDLQHNLIESSIISKE